jgi:hypothetical protein
MRRPDMIDHAADRQFSATKAFDRPLARCVDSLKPRSHIVYTRSNPTGSATPENRHRCGWQKRSSTRWRIPRGHLRRSLMCRTGFRRAAIPDRSRKSIPMDRCMWVAGAHGDGPGLHIVVIDVPAIGAVGRSAAGKAVAAVRAWRY